MTTGTKIIYTERPMDARKPRIWEGTVIRVDAPVPEDADGWGGWGAGITVEYTKIKLRGQSCPIFHEWPSLWAKEVT